jgi:hypothetical protein
VEEPQLEVDEGDQMIF